MSFKKSPWPLRLFSAFTAPCLHSSRGVSSFEWLGTTSVNRRLSMPRFMASALTTLDRFGSAEWRKLEIHLPQIFDLVAFKPCPSPKSELSSNKSLVAVIGLSWRPIILPQRSSRKVSNHLSNWKPLEDLDLETTRSRNGLATGCWKSSSGDLQLTSFCGSVFDEIRFKGKDVTHQWRHGEEKSHIRDGLMKGNRSASAAAAYFFAFCLHLWISFSLRVSRLSVTAHQGEAWEVLECFFRILLNQTLRTLHFKRPP